MLSGKGDTGLGKTIIHVAISPVVSKYSREENRLTKNVFEVLMAPLIHFPPATVPGMENVVSTNPVLMEGLWCGVWKGEKRRKRSEAM